MAENAFRDDPGPAELRPGQRVRGERVRRGWSQAELARRVGISRAAVSAIEIDRLSPSVTAALALAECFGCTVEDLFGSRPAGAPLQWSWPPRGAKIRYWQAEVAGRILSFPIEEPVTTEYAHDGVFVDGADNSLAEESASRTLVVACCDPAAGLLASQFARATGMRMIVLGRSSTAALELLAQNRVHAAGIHLSDAGGRRGNASV